MRISRSLTALITGVLLAASTAGAEELKMGIELPLTGPYARTGKSIMEGIQAAVEVFNKKNSRDKVKVTVIDDETVVSKAVSAVEKLSADGNLAILGGFTTRLIAPSAAAAGKEGIAYLTVGATSSDILERGYKTFFRINNNEGYNEPVIQFIIQSGVKKVSMLTLNTQGNMEAGADVKKRLGARGIKVVEHRFDPGMTDYKPLINKIKVQDQPELLLMNCIEAENIGVLRAAKVLKPNVKAIIGMYSTQTAKMANDFTDLVQNLLGPAIIASPPEFRTADGKEFDQAFRKLYNREPDNLNQLGYVKGQVMIDALKRAADKKNLTKAGVIAELRKTNRNTLIGHVSFNEKGDNTHFMSYLSQHQPGKKIPIVWPKEVANAKINYPALPW